MQACGQLWVRVCCTSSVFCYMLEFTLGIADNLQGIGTQADCIEKSPTAILEGCRATGFNSLRIQCTQQQVLLVSPRTRTCRSGLV